MILARTVCLLSRGVTVAFAAAVLFASGALTAPQQARAAFGIASFTGKVSANEAGDPATQAGSHPYAASTTIEFNSHLAFGFLPMPDENAKTIEVDLPVGFVGNPTVVPKCSREAFSSAGALTECPDASAVGVIRLTGGVSLKDTPLALYNLEPEPGVPAQFGFKVEGASVIASATVRAGGDYGLRVRVVDIPQTLPVTKAIFTLWGTPADPRHDLERGHCASLFVPDDVCPAGVPPRAFLANPTDCAAGPLPTTVRVESWQHPGDFRTASFSEDEDGVPMAVENCAALPFKPSFTVAPTSNHADAPSGYEFSLELPQSDDPLGLATAHLKEAAIALPEGVSISPPGSHGLEGCAAAQIDLSSPAAPTCPRAARIGSVTVDTPLLADPLEGSVYVASQGDNPFQSVFAMYIVAHGSGVVIKLAGRVNPDPITGQVQVTFANNPQLPFSRLRVSLKGGPTAPLANPPTCGVKTATASLGPWSGGPPSEVSSTFTIECPGAAGFAPVFGAGALLPVGGRFSPFGVRIERSDRQETLNGVSIATPPGLIARLKGVPRCPDASAYAGTCGVGTRVGTATVGAGAGVSPYYVQGSVSLTGPYKGAPYGLAVSVRATAGPFDLGTVVVRQAIFIDPVDASLTVISDPLPTIIEGVPLRLRSINVDIDRPGFTLNPTSCAPKEISATLTSAQGAVHRATQRFQVGDCQALPLRPRLALRLTGRRQTEDGDHPGLRAVLTQRPGQANLERVAVRLPLSLALDPDNAQELCEFEAGQRVDCPASSIIGQAKAFTPVLDEPLTGPVYFVKGVRVDRRTGRQIRTLPTLLIPLRGEVAIDLRATSSVKRGKLVSTFSTVPDAPVSRFELNLKGGKGGILVVTGDRDLCKGKHTAQVEIDGHNGKRHDPRVRMKTPCARRSARR